MTLQVELIYDVDCPHIAAARVVLLQAFAHAGIITASWKEWTRTAPDTPPHLREYGSPTILVNGEDVAGAHSPGGGNCCRLYSSGGTGFSGVPPVEQIVSALTNGNTGGAITGSKPGVPSGWRGLLAVVPALGASLLPLGTCPACWPAYAGLFGTLGLGFLLEKTYLLPVTIVLLGLAFVSLVYHAKARRGYGPFALGMVAVSLVLVGKFFFFDPLVYVGLALLMGASVWNA
jgi:hypothetical protein